MSFGVIDIQSYDCSTNLNGLLMTISYLHYHVVLLHKGTEFGFIIEDIESILTGLNKCMNSGNSNVTNFYLRIISSAKPYAFRRNFLYHYNTFISVRRTFQNDIVTVFRLFDRY